MTTTAAGDVAVARLNKATEAFEKIITGASNQVVDVPGYGNQPTLAGRVDQRLDEITATAAAEANRSRDEANRATTQATSAANSVTLSTAEYNKAKTQADRAQSEADRTAQITGLSTVSDAIGLAALPLPDVWAPLSDSLRMITGYGRDVLVGSDVVARMVNFSRNSTATYIGKDGQLKTAAANEPRFEKEGLLIEGQSTNLIPWSRGADYSKNPSYFLSNASAVTNGDALVVTVTAQNGGVGGVLSGTHEGKTTTVSLWAKGAVGGERLRVGLSTDQLAMPFDVVLTTEWVRYSKTYSIGASDTRQTGIRIYAQSPCTFSIDKVQCEELPFATSYIPTNGAASTRAADQVWLPAAGNRFIGGLYAVAFEFDLLGRVASGVSEFSRLIDFDNSGGSDRQHISLTAAGQLQCVVGGSFISSVAGKLAGLAAMRMNNLAMNVMMDGVAGSSVTASGVGSSANNRIVLMNSNLFQLPSYGHIRNIRVWSKHPITNDQLRTAV
ncbi:phage head spike fiber domain-containing protein [Aeromonas veronii]|uniref:phage head spike fiber domain-containing protein n=1 Tax=Aeromonas veronii TaxID=654 RepID=UPI003D19C9A5